MTNNTCIVIIILCIIIGIALLNSNKQDSKYPADVNMTSDIKF